MKKCSRCGNPLPVSRKSCYCKSCQAVIAKARYHKTPLQPTDYQTARRHTAVDHQTAKDPRLEAYAKICAAVMDVPREKRLDVLAVAIRALLDSGELESEPSLSRENSEEVRENIGN